MRPLGLSRGVCGRGRRIAETRGPTPPVICEQLLPVAHAARHARNVVTDACLRWGMPHLVAPAALIISELVSNVVDHAHTLMTIEVVCRPSHLYLAVQDCATDPPVRRDLDDTIPPVHGRGLILVETAATAWGYDYQEGGKTVWATVSRDRATPGPLP
jgi:anti-sigma regulatory factor (Ser/Thr protein kinase)